MIHIPTFSQLPRFFACQLGDVLPSADESGDDAKAGSARHAFFQRVTELLQPSCVSPSRAGYPLDQARELALAEAGDEYQEILAAIPLEALGLENIAAEVALALDLTTGAGRELGRGLGRDYSSKLPSEAVGTIDRLGFIGEDGLHVGDYKGRAHRTAPDEDPQFLAAALAASRAYGRTWAEIEVLNVIGDEVYPRRARVDLVQLDTFELRLQERVTLAARNLLAFQADKTLPEGEVGDHCRWCPHHRFCPAMGALARYMLGGDSQEVEAIVEVGEAYITPENAPRLWDAVKRAEQVLPIIKSALQDYARQSPFQLTDGRRYGVPPDSKEREITDGRKASAVLVELFGEEATKKGAKVEVSFEGVERAVKAWIAEDARRGYRGAIKEGKEKAETVLKERGLLRISTGGVVKPFKPKEA